jgi:CheY-like chemotaxis protein
MDLAMPGIDGWETIRRLRRDGLCRAHIAIISANAFDKNLDNDVGIAPRDFITKPVRVADLLDWIGSTLGLQWVVAEAKSAREPAAINLPVAEHLQAIDQLAAMGYLRGLLDKLNEIDALDARYAEFVARLRPLARRFEFEIIRGIVGGRRNEPP